MSVSRWKWGAATVSATLLHTESTTNSLDAIPVFGSTENQASEQAIVLWQWTDQLLRWSFPVATADQALPRTEHFSIDDLGEAGYRVLQPIPVEIRRVGIVNFEASFREANIAISGSDQDDAYQALVAEILETLDVLLTEQNLGPDATEQRRILRTYIVRA